MGRAKSFLAAKQERLRCLNQGFGQFPLICDPWNLLWPAPSCTEWINSRFSDIPEVRGVGKSGCSQPKWVWVVLNCEKPQKSNFPDSVKPHRGWITPLTGEVFWKFQVPGLPLHVSSPVEWIGAGPRGFGGLQMGENGQKPGFLGLDASDSPGSAHEKLNNSAPIWWKWKIPAH